MKIYLKWTTIFFFIILCEVKAEPYLNKHKFHQSLSEVKSGHVFFFVGDELSKNTIVHYSISSKYESLIKTKSNISNTHEPIQIISHADSPNLLIARWPELAIDNVPYNISVLNSRGEMSNSIVVNDIRPLWFSPMFSFETFQIGTLPRQIKIIGKNFHRGKYKKLTVRLINIESHETFFDLKVIDNKPKNYSIDEYVIVAELPDKIDVGEYQVLVGNKINKKIDWKIIPGQLFLVKKDIVSTKVLNIENYGCEASDEKSDADCLNRAIKDANRISSDTPVDIYFPKGIWNFDLNDVHRTYSSFVLAKNVNLLGAGIKNTYLKRNIEIKTNIRKSDWFILKGNNIISGITFSESKPNNSRYKSSILKLGQESDPAPGATLKNIFIIDNKFNSKYRTIIDSGININNLVIYNNIFKSYKDSIFLNGFKQELIEPYNIQDSIISNNIFYPGDYMNVLKRSGSIATQIGASERMDFSNNFADGSINSSENSKKSDTSGWRAGFFWHMHGNNEMLLVSGNKITCSGDKTGDGEAIAFDNNHNTNGFDKIKSVISSSNDRLVVAANLKKYQEKKKVSSDYYSNHWIYITQGKGIGQVRKVVSYTEKEQQTVFRVYPDWDVVPDSTSKVDLGLQFWQLLVIGNEIDHRKPLCKKSNRRPSDDVPQNGGAITLWAQASDSVISGNIQYDTNGIVMHPFYSEINDACPECISKTFYQYFNEIKNNQILGEYNWNSDCSWSGITVSYGAAPIKTTLPTIFYANSIVNNFIKNADGLTGGAISLVPGWWDGNKNKNSKLLRSSIIADNTITEIINSKYKIKTCKRNIKNRKTIELASNNIFNSMIESNICTGNKGAKVNNNGIDTYYAKRKGIKLECK